MKFNGYLYPNVPPLQIFKILQDNLGQNCQKFGIFSFPGLLYGDDHHGTVMKSLPILEQLNFLSEEEKI